MTKDEISTWQSDRVLPEYQPIVQAIRAAIKKHAPEAEEMMTNGTPAYPGNLGWRVKRIIALISPTKVGVTLALTEGAKFDDKYKLLEGVGNKSRNLRYKNLGEVDEDVIAYYIRQAVEADQK